MSLANTFAAPKKSRPLTNPERVPQDTPYGAPQDLPPDAPSGSWFKVRAETVVEFLRVSGKIQQT